MNKPSLPPTARLLDIKAIETLKEVATEFAVFNSAASDKVGSRGDPASILTSVVAEAVDRPPVSAPMSRPAINRNNAPMLSRRILSGYQKRRFFRDAAICSKQVGRRSARW